MLGLKPLLLGPPRLTLAVAESITCGRVQAQIGTISGASEFFLGGITAYSLDQKVRHLGVDRAAAAAIDCVSAAVAEQMARGACGLFGSDLGVATTGYAERAVGDPFAWWALAHRRPDGKFTVRSGKVDCPGASRTQAQDLVAGTALAALTEWVWAVRR